MEARATTRGDCCGASGPEEQQQQQQGREAVPCRRHFAAVRSCAALGCPSTLLLTLRGTRAKRRAASGVPLGSRWRGVRESVFPAPFVPWPGHPHEVAHRMCGACTACQGAIRSGRSPLHPRPRRRGHRYRRRPALRSDRRRRPCNDRRRAPRRTRASCCAARARAISCLKPTHLCLVRYAPYRHARGAVGHFSG